jgi:4-hydroxymandelate oxidase
MTGPAPEPLNLPEYEDYARAALPRAAFDYFAGGSDDGVTLAENRRAFAAIDLRPRVLTGVGRRDLAVSVLGRTLSLPVLVAPMGLQCLAHPEGERATARAAAAADTVLVVSTMATTRVEDIAAASGGGPLWFQLYVFKDRGLTRALVARAEAAGCAALQLTADVPVLGRREADARNGFGLPPGLSVAHFAEAGHGGMASCQGESGPSAYTRAMFDDTLTWDDVSWLRSVTRLPVLVKGVLRGDDAARAVEHGAAGVVVSNHGGRQLDTAVAAVRALPEVAEAVAGRGVVLLDGGVRRGTDVVKALALGATAVQVGRPVLWGLALAGADGARRVLELLRAEIDAAFALCGCAAVGDVRRDLVRVRG